MMISFDNSKMLRASVSVWSLEYKRAAKATLIRLFPHSTARERVRAERQNQPDETVKISTAESALPVLFRVHSTCSPQRRVCCTLPSPRPMLP